jgi:hypothetical protein
LVVVVVVVVSEGAASLLFQVVVVCLCTTPGDGSTTVFFWSTVPLSQVVEDRVPGAGVIVVVCVSGTGVTTGAVTWTTNGGAGTVSTSLVVSEKQLVSGSATDPAKAGAEILYFWRILVLPP